MVQVGIQHLAVGVGDPAGHVRGHLGHFHPLLGFDDDVVQVGLLVDTHPVAEAAFEFLEQGDVALQGGQDVDQPGF